MLLCRTDPFLTPSPVNQRHQFRLQILPIRQEQECVPVHLHPHQAALRPVGCAPPHAHILDDARFPVGRAQGLRLFQPREQRVVMQAQDEGGSALAHPLD